VSTVSTLAAEAKLDLSWLAFVHQALKELQDCVGHRALALIRGSRPPSFVVHRESSQQEALNLNSAFADFWGMAHSAPGATSDDAGHYLNKSCIVYATAIVESFVKRRFDETFVPREQNGKFQPGPLDDFASLNRYIEVITGGKAGKSGKAKFPRKVYRESFRTGNEGVLFMAKLRHNIVHAHGEMNDKEITAIEPAAKNVDGRQFPAGFANEFICECRKQKRVWLHVVKVVMPCLWSAFRFVDDAEGKFVQARPAAGQGAGGPIAPMGQVP
jgi:hypothetical protein